MARPLMPKATAVWLVENTALTFEQISEFCGLHPLEVQAIADDEVAIGMQGMDPIANGELTSEEIDRCVADPTGRLEMAPPSVVLPMPLRAMHFIVASMSCCRRAAREAVRRVLAVAVVAIGVSIMA